MPEKISRYMTSSASDDRGTGSKTRPSSARGAAASFTSGWGSRKSSSAGSFDGGAVGASGADPVFETTEHRSHAIGEFRGCGLFRVAARRQRRLQHAAKGVDGL